MSYPDLAAPLRTALIAEAGITTNLSAYKGSFPVFTRRPAPVDAPFPMILVSPDVAKTDRDGINDWQPIITRDVTVYGQNSTSAKYRTVEDIAFAIHDLFHGQRNAISVSDWHVIQIRARGPIPAPVDDDQTVARMVMLEIQLAQQN